MPISRVRRVTPCAVTTASPATAMTSATALSPRKIDIPRRSGRVLEVHLLIAWHGVDVGQQRVSALRLMSHAHDGGARRRRRRTTSARCGDSAAKRSIGSNNATARDQPVSR